METKNNTNTEKVFVYGTLMRGFINHDKVLKNRVRHVERGRVSGSLYHLPAGYPAVIEGDQTIHGEVITISQLKVIRSLDLLEGYMGEGKDNLYERKKLDVVLEDGSLESCWVYVYADPKYVQRHGKQVEHGNWAQFMTSKRK